MSQTMLLLPGDGIGPEVTEQARRVAEALVPDLSFEEALVGGAAIDAEGEPLSVDTLVKAKSSDAVLLGAVGGPKWADVERHLRPEMGLLQLRKGMDTFANLRPAFCFPALVDASSLKREVVEGLDIMIVRELTSGVYFGEPRGFERGIGDKSFGYETSRYTKGEIDRVSRVAFDIARGRRGEVASTEKSNVMESGLFWRETVTELHAAEGEGIALRHVLADACAMELVRDPKQFDVILAGNLFGDILSDAAAMLTGSIGMLPSASLSYDGKPGLYEPVHGSAPDIAGQGIANPIAMLSSLAMCLRYSFNMGDVADRLERAITTVLDQGLRTGDIMQDGMTKVSTAQMGEAVVKAMGNA